MVLVLVANHLISGLTPSVLIFLSFFNSLLYAPLPLGARSNFLVGKWHTTLTGTIPLEGGYYVRVLG
jgi:hypothetical protein